MPKNHVGEKFGLLTVIEKAVLQSKHDKWRCICDCGKMTVSFGFTLRNGSSKSCGCVAAKKSKERWKNPSLAERQKQSEKAKTHGMSKHPAYQSWADMRQRCQKPNHKWFASYGGRGIIVCNEWQRFEKFWEDMGPTWFEGAQIGRKDNDAGYSKQNCKWETAQEQQSNKSNSVIMNTPDGEMTMSEAARKYGMTPGCLRYRMSVGYSGASLFKPSQRKSK